MLRILWAEYGRGFKNSKKKRIVIIIRKIEETFLEYIIKKESSEILTVTEHKTAFMHANISTQ